MCINLIKYYSLFTFLVIVSINANLSYRILTSKLAKMASKDHKIETKSVEPIAHIVGEVTCLSTILLSDNNYIH